MMGSALWFLAAIGCFFWLQSYLVRLSKTRREVARREARRELGLLTREEAREEHQVNWHIVFEIERDLYTIPHYHKQTPGAPDWMGDGPPDWWEEERQKRIAALTTDIDEALAPKPDPLDEAFKVIEEKMTANFGLPPSVIGSLVARCYLCGISPMSAMIVADQLYCETCYPKRRDR